MPLAVAPQRARRGRGSVATATSATSAHSLDRAAERVGRIGVRRRLDEHVRDVRRRERARQTEPIAHELEAVVEEQLDRVHAVELAAQRPDRVERGVDVVERAQRDDREPGRRVQPERAPR